MWLLTDGAGEKVSMRDLSELSEVEGHRETVARAQKAPCLGSSDRGVRSLETAQPGPEMQ